ncbi:MAG: histidine kinase, partial [Bacteroidota bacterium]
LPILWKGGLQIFENYEDLRQGISTKHLEGHIISDVLVDEAGGLWISTDGEGVYYSSNTKVEVYNQQSGFSDDYVNAISLKDEKGPFVGLRNGDCYQLDPSNQKLQSLSPNTGEIYALAYDSYMDQLWKASAYQTSVLELKDQNASNFTSIHFPHVYKKINSHPSGHIWGNCAANYGFAQHDAQSKECLFFARYDNKKLCQWTFCTHEDLTGRIWIGRIDGLFEFKDGDLLPPSIEHPALKLRIEEIKHLADSTLVIGTKGAGVLLWKDDRIQQIDESTGLTTDMIEKIHIDSAQNIWVGTPNGLNRVKRSSNGQFDIYHYTTADGFPSNEITDIDSYGAHIWVATNKGLVHLPPNNRIEKQTIAQPNVSKVIVNYEAIEPDRSHDLSHKESNIQFHFFAIDYQQNGNIPYRFRLHEADPWGYTKSTNVSYAALSPGDYHFEVQAAGKNGQWGPSAKYSFAIHPPFWKQAWFIISGLLFLLGLTNLLYQNRIRKIKNKIQLDLQIQELKRSALQAQMNPHFIFNCLHSIQGFILEKNTEAAIHYLSHFSHLIRAVLNASAKQSIALEEETELLQNYMELEKSRMKHPFDYHIVVDPALDASDVFIPPLLIQPIVENAIIHGLSKMDRKGRIEICCQAFDESNIKVIVRDNGMGIQKKRNGSIHPSLGMGITQKRLEIQQLNTNKKDLLSIKSLAGVEGWEQGTQLEMLIATVTPTDWD